VNKLVPLAFREIPTEDDAPEPIKFMLKAIKEGEIRAKEWCDVLDRCCEKNYFCLFCKYKSQCDRLNEFISDHVLNSTYNPKAIYAYKLYGVKSIQEILREGKHVRCRAYQ
jgi:hypothetical protein